ncbi:hypothetical protein V8G54_022146 [Vigna mungo]|uniref:Xylanase inhibitor N-terminal domain-containing protein n=1 Tax=Vigna mungo TaxID=3915 RepID=A0AAQ3NH12_VIGMU
MDLTLYDIKESSSGQSVPCDQQFCKEVNGGLLSGCTTNITCPYLEIYGDGSSTAGDFVKDIVLYEQVSGDLKTDSANGSIIFGHLGCNCFLVIIIMLDNLMLWCGARQSGDLSSSNEEALDGILGFGKANSSMISQLASSGKVKKMFAHCLNGVNGGGIFAIGHVVQPKVKMTPLLPDHLSIDASTQGDGKGTIIDSGTTLAYLPEGIYEPLVSKFWKEGPKYCGFDNGGCFQTVIVSLNVVFMVRDMSQKWKGGECLSILPKVELLQQCVPIFPNLLVAFLLHSKFSRIGPFTFHF